MSGSGRSPQEVLVELAREYEDAYRERRDAPPESNAEVELDGYRRGLRKAIELFEGLDDFEKHTHLPEWQIGLENTEGDWEWYYPHALTRERAIKKAREEAQETLGDGHLNAYDVAGPAATDGGGAQSYRLPKSLRFGPDEAERLVEAATDADVDLNAFCCRAIFEAVESQLSQDSGREESRQ